MGTPLKAMSILARAAGHQHHAARSSPPGLLRDWAGFPSPTLKGQDTFRASLISFGDLAWAEVGRGNEELVAAGSPCHSMPTAS